MKNKQYVKQKLRTAFRSYFSHTFSKDLLNTSYQKSLQIARNDGKRIFSSVVCLVMLFGLCVVPCLYAWFNIFSNWDPYGTDATSRIRVAVVSEDKGTEVLGLYVNVGEKVLTGLEANDSIGWVFTDDPDDALQRVYSGDCYAAIVIPNNFSADTLSFLNLQFKHPTLMYYENDKKNAIAPKITGKAKNAVQETVNSTFIKTLTGGIGEVLGVLNENGFDFEQNIRNLADKTGKLSEKLDYVDAMLTSSIALANASQRLMYYSGITVGDVASTAYATGNSFYTISQDTAGMSSFLSRSAADVLAVLEYTDSQLVVMQNTIGGMQQDFSAYAETYAADISSMSTRAFELAQYCQQNGGISPEMLQLINSLGYLGNECAAALTIDTANEAIRTDTLAGLMSRITECRASVASGLSNVSNDLNSVLAQGFASMSSATSSLQAAFEQFGYNAGDLSQSLFALMEPLGSLSNDLSSTQQDVRRARTELDKLKDTLAAFSSSDYLKRLTGVIEDDPDIIGSYFASPIQMDTEVLYPIENYGSAMAPFYTVLAQWVGALFCICLLKTQLPHRDMSDYTMHEHFFGRSILFIVCGMIQAVVVALGDLFYVGIYAAHPLQFFFAVCMTGFCFILINYSLLFSLQNIGLGASVIVMVIQVAGSGGSYPVEVVPPIFRALYPFMPFNYAMNAMREAIGGNYGNNFGNDLMILLLMAAISMLVCQLLYYPAKYLNDLIRESMKESEIMNY